MIQQRAAPADFGRFERLHAFRQSHLRHHQGRADLLDLVGPLELALREDAVLLDADLDAVTAQFPRQAQGEIGRHQDFAQFPFAQEKTDDGGQARPLDFAAQLFQALIVGYDPAVPRLFADPGDFQVVDRDVAVAVNAEVNKRLRHEQADGIKHVGVVRAVGHHQKVFGIAHGFRRQFFARGASVDEFCFQCKTVMGAIKYNRPASNFGNSTPKSTLMAGTSVLPKRR